MRKAQVSVFIIMGLILLVLSSITLYVINTNNKTNLNKGIELPEESIVADTFIPIQVFVKECLNNIAYNGIISAGLHGGYVDLKDRKIYGTGSDGGIYNELSRTDIDDSTESSRLIKDGFDIPYWSYNKNPNQVDRIRLSNKLVPKLKRNYQSNNLDLTIQEYQKDHSIEAQLDRYVYHNLNLCLNDFNVFKEQGFEISYDENFRPLVTINDGYINLFLDLKLNINNGELNQKLDYFIDEIDVDFKDAYEIAYDINTQLFNNKPFLSEYTMQMIFENSGLETDQLPPIYEVSTNQRPVKWSIPFIKNIFEYNLMSSIQDLNFPRTKNYINVSQSNIIEDTGHTAQLISQFENAAHELNTYDILRDDYSHLGVNMFYLGWPTYFKIDQAWANKFLTGVTYDNYIDFAKLQETIYDFSYSFSYPVIVEIDDDDAFVNSKVGKKGFTFTTAYEVNVKSNNVEINLPQTLISVESDEEDQIITQFCDETQHILKTKINVFDDDELLLDKVPEFIYSCDGGIDDISCYIDQETNGFHYFPTCMNAKITFVDENYENRKFDIGDMLFGNFNEELNFTLAKVRKFNYDFKKILHGSLDLVIDQGHSMSTLLLNVEPDEMAEVRLERIQDNLNDPEFFESIYTGPDDRSLQEIKLIPGFYKVDGNYIKLIPALYEKNGETDYTFKLIVGDFTDEDIKRKEEEGHIVLTEIPYGILDAVLNVKKNMHLANTDSTLFIFPTFAFPPRSIKDIPKFSSIFYEKNKLMSGTGLTPKWVYEGAIK